MKKYLRSNSKSIDTEYAGATIRLRGKPLADQQKGDEWMDDTKKKALLEAFEKMLDADLIDLDSIRLTFKAPKGIKQGKEPREADQQED